MVVNFIEGWTPQEGASYDGPERDQGRSIKGIFQCHGGTPYLPQATVMHFIETNSSGQVCYRDRVCGNLKAWHVAVGLSLSLWDYTTTLDNFISTDDFIQLEYSTDGSLLSIDVGVEFGTVERSCGEISQEICL